jgi:RimJ/RimL family protein N-acetyltransferase
MLKVINMNKLNLTNFNLEVYQDYNDLHHNVIDKLSMDKNTQKYLGDLNYLITRIKNRYQENYVDTLYIAYLNDEPIGIITLCVRDDKYEIDYGILPEYRNQHLATTLVKEFSAEIFKNYPRIDKLYFQIDNENTTSQGIVSRLGAVKESNNNYAINR